MDKSRVVISHWAQLIQDFQTSPLGFYSEVEAVLQRREVPDMHRSRVEFKEAGVMTAKREYLRLMRGRYVFDICAAPFGTGSFFSWWLTEPSSPYGPLYFIGFLCSLAFVMRMLFVVGVASYGFFFGVFLSLLGAPAFCWFIGRLIREGIIELEHVVLVTPVIGKLYERIFSPPTYYVLDNAMMFQEAVHNAVLEVIDQVTSAKGARVLSEFERKPILKSFAKSA